MVFIMASIIADSKGEQTSGEHSLLILPSELLVYIIAFLTVTRDKVRLRYVSRRLRGVCETSSLWREFIWPYFDIREEHCVKSVLKSCGRFINRLSFPHHVIPSKLPAFLQYCNDVVDLSLPLTTLSPGELKMIIAPMRRLQSLEIPWKSDKIDSLFVICSGLKELSITAHSFDTFEMLLTEWANKQFIPETLQLISTAGPGIYDLWPAALIRLWLSLNPSSPTDHIAYFKVYDRLKGPMDLVQPPLYQLHFGQSCTLPLVQASTYNLLGLEKDLLHLSNCKCGNRELYKAIVVKREDHGDMIQSNHFNSNVVSLAFLTHFTAKDCHLYSEHLEVLAIACPNLMELNLTYNANCLKTLKALRTVASSCKHLRGLNLLRISVKNVESHMQLWEILVKLKLTYLAIDTCILFPNKQVKDLIIDLQQKCSDLEALEVSDEDDGCDHCNVNREYGDFLLLSNFSSLIHLHCTCHHSTAVKEILSSCKNLKYFVYYFDGFTMSTFPFATNCSLEQLHISISRGGDIPDNFMESISAHGGLVHVELLVASVTFDGVTALIKNSPDLMTCCIANQNFEFTGVHLKPEDFVFTLKKTFSNRKLFSCGFLYLGRLTNGEVVGYNTELFCDYFLTGEHNSLWPIPFDADVLFDDIHGHNTY